MNELVVIVEGQTEQTFVRNLLSGHLALLGITAWPVLPGTNRNRGGVKKWESARNDIIRTLKEGRYCSTMYDFYALPTGWPGREEAAKKPWQEKADYVEAALLKEVTIQMGPRWDPRYFIPYIQLHEFEALLFSETGTLASVVSAIANRTTQELKAKFDAILLQKEFPEAINDHSETSPSYRILKIIPAFSKATQGPIIAEKIGLPLLRERCHHFASWLDRLETLHKQIDC